MKMFSLSHSDHLCFLYDGKYKWNHVCIFSIWMTPVMAVVM